MFYRHFFTKGDGWLYDDPFLPHEIAGLQMVEPLAPNKNLWVWPRGHKKTTFKKLHYIRRALFSMRRYMVIFTATEQNQVGWSESLGDFFERDDLFPEAHYFFPYFFNGNPALAAKRNAGELSLSNDVMLQFRSFRGEARGLNRRGRPDEIELDDTMPSEAAESSTIRDKFRRRFLGVVRFIGSKDSQVNASATIVAPDDQWHMIVTNRIPGWRYQHLEACDADFGNVLNPYLWSTDKLKEAFEEFAASGDEVIFHREMRNDAQEAINKPFAAMNYLEWTPGDFEPNEMYRVISVDNSGGAGGDDFVIYETGQTPPYVVEDGTGTRHTRSEVRTLDIFAKNVIAPDQKYAEVLAFLERRRPHKLVIQRTSESRDFIDRMEKYLPEHHMHITIEQPTVTRNKNEYIKEYLYPRLKNETFRLKPGHTENAKFIRQAKDFDITKDRQPDDMIEMAATCIEYSRPAAPRDTRPKRPEQPRRAAIHDAMTVRQVVGDGYPKWK